VMNKINKESFGGRQVVTCWTCHRGAPSPAITPPIDTVYGESVFTPTDVLPVANPANAGTPPADQILDKYIQALGGADDQASHVAGRRTKCPRRPGTFPRAADSA